jgi:hypothetical protein
MLAELCGVPLCCAITGPPVPNDTMIAVARLNALR